MRQVIFIGLTGMLFVVLQTTNIGFLVPAGYKPDLVLILVLWTALRADVPTGMGFAFLGGTVVDLLSGSPTGLFALIYCVIFVACWSLNSTFEIDRPTGRIVTASGATLLAAGAVLLTRRLAGPVGIGAQTFHMIIARSIIAGIVCLVAIPLLDRMWMGYTKWIGAR